MILYVLTIDFLAIMSPGPDFFMVLKNTLTDSLKAGFYTTLGITLGGCISFALGILGVGAIIVNSKILFEIIKYCGVLYLTYLALKAIFTKPRVSEPQMVYNTSNFVNKGQYFRIGLVCNLTNPKAYLFIISLSTYVAQRGNPHVDGWFIILGSSLATFLWFNTVSIIFGRISVRKIFYSKQKIINVLFGIVLLYVASRMIIM